MNILRVFNNNVVLARDDAGKDVIVTGRGLGFQARPGQAIDESKIFRVFVPADGRDADHLAELVSGIPEGFLLLVARSLKRVGVSERLVTSPTLVIALADHIQFAIERRKTGLTLEYPLQAEVENLYAEEYATAVALLAELNKELDSPLPESEAVALSLHLVNAGFSSGDLSQTYTMTGIIQQMLEVIESTYSISLESASVNVGRFITHLRYLFVRISQHRQLNQDHLPIGTTIRESYPEAHKCAQRIAAIVELRLGAGITNEELSYLTLHIARLSSYK